MAGKRTGPPSCSHRNEFCQQPVSWGEDPGPGRDAACRHPDDNLGAPEQRLQPSRCTLAARGHCETSHLLLYVTKLAVTC